jgi:hypothetical protein
VQHRSKKEAEDDLAVDRQRLAACEQRILDQTGVVDIMNTCFEDALAGFQHLQTAHDMRRRDREAQHDAHMEDAIASVGCAMTVAADAQSMSVVMGNIAEQDRRLNAQGPTPAELAAACAIVDQRAANVQFGSDLFMRLSLSSTLHCLTLISARQLPTH